MNRDDAAQSLGLEFARELTDDEIELVAGGVPPDCGNMPRCCITVGDSTTCYCDEVGG